MTEEDQVTRYDYCPECGGLGTHVSQGMRGDECDHCDGYGVVPDEWGWDQDIGGEG